MKKYKLFRLLPVKNKDPKLNIIRIKNTFLGESDLETIISQMIISRME